MAGFAIKGPKFEGAYCTVDTFRHLLTDATAISHLRNVSRCLKKNGIYVLGLHLLPRQGLMEKLHRWHGSRGKLTVHSSINVLDVDRKHRTEILGYTLRTGIKRYRSVYSLRTYTIDQFHRLLDKANCFEIMNVYDLDYDLNKPVQLDTQSEEAVLLLKNR